MATNKTSAAAELLQSLPDDPTSIPDDQLQSVLIRFQVELQNRSVLKETPARITDAARPFLQLGGDIAILHAAVDAAVPPTSP